MINKPNKILNLQELLKPADKLQNNFDIRREVDKLADEGKSAGEIAGLLGLDIRTVSKIINGG